MCEIGYFDDNGAAKCTACHYSCEKCVSSASCNTCDLDTEHRFLKDGPYC